MRLRLADVVHASVVTRTLGNSVKHGSSSTAELLEVDAVGHLRAVVVAGRAPRAEHPRAEVDGIFANRLVDILSEKHILAVGKITGRRAVCGRNARNRKRIAGRFVCRSNRLERLRSEVLADKRNRTEVREVGKSRIVCLLCRDARTNLEQIDNARRAPIVRVAEILAAPSRQRAGIEECLNRVLRERDDLAALIVADLVGKRGGIWLGDARLHGLLGEDKRREVHLCNAAGQHFRADINILRNRNSCHCLFPLYRHHLWLYRVRLDGIGC